MAAALVLACVDPRLNHELLRIQVRQKLERLRIVAHQIYVLNDIGGNVGANFRNTVHLLVRRQEPILLAAVLHHDDCLAAQEGLRTPLDVSAKEITAYLADQGIHCPVLTGTVRLEHNHILWSDEPEPRYEPFSFYTHRG